MKYPGAFILNEVGTRKDLAAAYGVSERTIYRWLNKAADESGVKLTVKNRRPRSSTLEKFTGTRKQLAKKYGVSERTVYRWLNKAALEGKEVKRRSRSKYPGAAILADPRKTKDIAEDLGVSPRTVNRWKARARMEQAHRPEPSEQPPQPPQDETPPLDEVGEPWELPEPEDIGEPWEVPDPEDVGEPWEVPEPEPEPEAEEYTKEYTDHQKNLDAIYEMLFELDLLAEHSILESMPKHLATIYIESYLEYMIDHFPELFYDKETHEMRTDPEWLSELDIWKNDFESWLEKQTDFDNVE